VAVAVRAAVQWVAVGACGFGIVQRPASACIAAGGRVAGRPRACGCVV